MWLFIILPIFTALNLFRNWRENEATKDSYTGCALSLNLLLHVEAIQLVSVWWKIFKMMSNQEERKEPVYLTADEIPFVVTKIETLSVEFCPIQGTSAQSAGDSCKTTILSAERIHVSQFLFRRSLNSKIICLLAILMGGWERYGYIYFLGMFWNVIHFQINDVMWPNEKRPPNGILCSTLFCYT